MKQVEEEYYKAEEKVPHAPNNTHPQQNTNISELYPPSPDQPLSMMSHTSNIPDPVKHAISSLIKSSKTLHNKSQSSQSSPVPTPPLTPPPESNVIIIPEIKNKFDENTEITESK
jgi:hypothetical protein